MPPRLHLLTSLAQMSAPSSALRQLFLSTLWASILEAPQPWDHSLVGISARNSFCTLPQLVFVGLDEGSFLSGLPGKMGMAFVESCEAALTFVAEAAAQTRQGD